MAFGKSVRDPFGKDWFAGNNSAQAGTEVGSNGVGSMSSGCEGVSSVIDSNEASGGNAGRLAMKRPSCGNKLRPIIISYDESMT